MGERYNFFYHSITFSTLHYIIYQPNLLNKKSDKIIDKNLINDTINYVVNLRINGEIMESLRELYKIGRGPSSSHTMGPDKACKYVLANYDGDRYEATLYGSLSLTGKGHLTDQSIKDALVNVEVIFSSKTIEEHPNTMDIKIYKNDIEIGNERFYSIGGGSILREGEKKTDSKSVYELTKFDDIRDYCEKKNIKLHDFVYEVEGEEIKEYLKEVWTVMKNSVKLGLSTEGHLPGVLNIQRKAKELYTKIRLSEMRHVSGLKLASAYAYAVSEVNASGGVIVTAPTCGASGVLPGVLSYLQEQHNYTDERIIDALATAGLIGNLVKHNASISGAEAGCQAEIGTACSMAAAATSELARHSIDSIEYASELALEHHLGLTCDPILGYVQIPCIERNAVGALRALNASELACFLYGSRKISFDAVVATMLQTGKDLRPIYRETSEGGLAVYYNKKISK